MANEEEAGAALLRVSTATITMILLKKGIRNTWMRGPHALGGQSSRVAGPAFTLRFVPAREDLATPASLSSPRSTRGAVEAMPEGCVVVAGTMGIADAGIFGDILCARMKQRGVRALVTDGALRDGRGVVDTGLPIWCHGVAAPASVSSLTFVGWQQPIGCGGVAIYPDDFIVADGDGAVVIPPALVPEVIRLGPEAEDFEAWVMRRVEAGARLPGLYPPNAETAAEYEAWRADRR